MLLAAGTALWPKLCELSGTIDPILARLEKVGWMDSTWEDPAIHEEASRPRRRFYQITEDGADKAHNALARAYRARKQPLTGVRCRPPNR